MSRQLATLEVPRATEPVEVPSATERMHPVLRVIASLIVAVALALTMLPLAPVAPAAVAEDGPCSFPPPCKVVKLTKAEMGAAKGGVSGAIGVLASEFGPGAIVAAGAVWGALQTVGEDQCAILEGNPYTTARVRGFEPCDG